MSKKYDDINENNSIDIIDLLSNLWKRKIFIFKISIIFTIIGIIFSLSLKNSFTASSIFYPHFQKNQVGQSQGLRNLAGLAGINLGNQGSENIPPSLYPKIISSPEFKIEILDSKINLEENEFSYREYLLNKSPKFNFKKILFYPITILSRFISKNEINKSLNKNYNNILELNNEEYLLHKNLSSIIILELNEKEGFIELSIKDNNPLIASQIAQIAQEILQKKIIEFKLKNLNDTYKFILEQLDIAKKNFYNLQDSLAIFSDKNINIKSDLFLNRYSRIESEYNISKNIYNELALSKEKTNIDVKRNTPIFTIIKPVVIPNEKSSPQRGVIVIFFSFIGLVIASSYILLKPILFQILKEFKY